MTNHIVTARKLAICVFGTTLSFFTVLSLFALLLQTPDYFPPILCILFWCFFIIICGKEFWESFGYELIWKDELRRLRGFEKASNYVKTEELEPFEFATAEHLRKANSASEQPLEADSAAEPSPAPASPLQGMIVFTPEAYAMTIAALTSANRSAASNVTSPCVEPEPCQECPEEKPCPPEGSELVNSAEQAQLRREAALGRLVKGDVDEFNNAE